MPPHVALYPLEKKPKVTENSTRTDRLFRDVKPQRRKADRAELTGGIEVTVEAERGKRLLSLKYPKKDDEAMPGTLNRVSIRVAVVGDNKVTSWAYELKYVCDTPYPEL